MVFPRAMIDEQWKVLLSPYLREGRGVHTGEGHIFVLTEYLLPH
jgi:hypothetical protein